MPVPDDIFKCISLNENVWISIKISLKFIPKSPIVNIPALIQIMVAWCRLVPARRQAIVWINDYRCIYAPVGLNKLTNLEQIYILKILLLYKVVPKIVP